MYKNLSSATKLFIVTSSVISLLLTGCASQSSKEENLTTLIHQRAADITHALPIKNNNYNFIMARPLPPATLELVVYSDTTNGNDSDEPFLSNFTRALCSNEKSRELLQAGAQYQIRLRLSNNQEKIRVVHYATCPHA